MKKLMIGAIFASTLALTGCVSTCDDLANASEVFEQKVKPCTSAGEEPTAFNINQCKNSLDKCTDSEKEALGKFANCIRELPECTPATEEGFTSALLACGLALNGRIGENCSTVIAGD